MAGQGLMPPPYWHARYATQPELTELLTQELNMPAIDVVRVVQAFGALGAPLDALVRIVVDADTDRPVMQDFPGRPRFIRAAPFIPEPVPTRQVTVEPPATVNLTELPDDTIRRLAVQLVYAEQLIGQAVGFINAVDGGLPDPGKWKADTSVWLKRVIRFPLELDDEVDL